MFRKEGIKKEVSLAKKRLKALRILRSWEDQLDKETTKFKGSCEEVMKDK